MILFILIAIGIALYTIFAKDWLIDSIKNIDETNKEVKKNIEYDNYNTSSLRKYNEHDYENVPKIIFQWFVYNILFNIINFIIVFIISGFAVMCCPKVESYYTFNINSLKEYDFNNPIDVVYIFMWMEELIPNYVIDVSKVPRVDEWINLSVGLLFYKI